jgi:hypothetical protein
LSEGFQHRVKHETCMRVGQKRGCAHAGTINNAM